MEKFVQDCKNALIWDKLIEVAPFAGAAMVTVGLVLVTVMVNSVSAGPDNSFCSKAISTAETVNSTGPPAR